MGLGLTKPVLEGERSSALGFFADDDAEALETAVFLGVDSLGTAAADLLSEPRLVALAVSFAGLLSGLLAKGDFNGDLAGFDVVLRVVLMGVAFGVSRLVAGDEDFSLSFNPEDPFKPPLVAIPFGSVAAIMVGSAGVSFVLVSSSSVILSGFGPGTISGV